MHIAQFSSRVRVMVRVTRAKSVEKNVVGYDVVGRKKRELRDRTQTNLPITTQKQISFELWCQREHVRGRALRAFAYAIFFGPLSESPGNRD